MVAIRRHRFGGFTITELLVVMALVVVLIILLIPAINSVRESSQRATCSANQNRLALALAKFDSQNGILPGWRHRVTLNGVNRWVGFIFPSLPFLDQVDVYNAYVQGSVTPGPSSGFNIDAFQCPAIGTTGGYQPGRGDYGSNFGTGYGTGFLGQQEGQVAPFRPFKDDGALADGGHHSQSLQGISAGDGISMTLLTSEVARNFWLQSGTVCWGPNEVGQGNFRGCNVFGLTVRAAGTPVIPVVTEGFQVINNSTLGVSPISRHPNGVVASFADGSTRFLGNSLAAHVYAHIVTSRSLFSNASPITYGNNSRNANSYLRGPPAPASPFKVTESDLE